MDFCLLNEKSQIFVHAEPYAVSDYVNQYVGTHSIRLPKGGARQAGCTTESSDASTCVESATAVA